MLWLDSSSFRRSLSIFLRLLEQRGSRKPFKKWSEIVSEMVSEVFRKAAGENHFHQFAQKKKRNSKTNSSEKMPPDNETPTLPLRKSRKKKEKKKKPREETERNQKETKKENEIDWLEIVGRVVLLRLRLVADRPHDDRRPVLVAAHQLAQRLPVRLQQRLVERAAAK